MRGVKGTGSSYERNKRWLESQDATYMRDKQRQWRERHPGYLGPKRQAMVDLVNTIKESNHCADCGGKFPACCMDFDHRGQDKHAEVGRLVARTTSHYLVMAEIEKCDLVCANCHRIRTRDKGSFGWTRIKKDEKPKTMGA